jgi:hypothetical protein
VVIIAALAQAGVAAPIIRDDQGPRRHGAIDESAKRFGAAVSGDGQPNAARIAPILPLVLRGPGFRWRTSTAQATRTLW